MIEVLEQIDCLVTRLNREAFDLTEGGLESISPFKFETDGEYQAITFFEYPLWDSESDEREMVVCHGEDVPEGLEIFIRRTANQLIEILSRIKL